MRSYYYFCGGIECFREEVFPPLDKTGTATGAIDTSKNQRKAEV
jgi:hypothetical protein